MMSGVTAHERKLIVISFTTENEIIDVTNIDIMVKRKNGSATTDPYSSSFLLCVGANGTTL